MLAPEHTQQPAIVSDGDVRVMNSADVTEILRQLKQGEENPQPLAGVTQEAPAKLGGPVTRHVHSGAGYSIMDTSFQ